MDFFSWVSLAESITEMFLVDAETIDAYIEQMQQSWLIGLCVGAGLFLIGLLLGGYALSVMAKKEGKKHSWLGYLPFVNTYYAGEIGGETSFFGQKMKRAGLYAMLAEIASCAFQVILLTGEILSLPYYEITSIDVEYGYTYVAPNTSYMSKYTAWMVDYDTVFSGLSYLFELIFFVFACVMFTALFRKYFARRPVIMTVLCAFLPLRGFVLFAVRKNEPVDYNAYIQSRMQPQYGPYGPNGGMGYGNNGYNNGYGNNGYNNGYGNNGYGDSGGYGGDAPDPFDDFSDHGSGGSSDSYGGTSGGASGGSSGGGSDPDNPFDEFN